MISSGRRPQRSTTSMPSTVAATLTEPISTCCRKGSAMFIWAIISVP